MRSFSEVKRRLVVLAAGVLTLALLPAMAGQHGAHITASVANASVIRPAVANPDVGSQQPGIAWEAPAERDANLDAMVAAGMTWVRADFFWDSIEQQRGQFSWTATDAFVQAAQARGLRVLGIADYTPAWARTGPTDKYPPTNPADYATFVGALAAHYGPMGVSDWEIWNEPNNAMFWAPTANPVAYTTLLKLADVAIKTADPSATVITGGLSPAIDNGLDVAPLTFLAAVYANGGEGSFDAVGYHPYSYPYAPMYQASWNTFYETPAVYQLMADHGDGGKQIWGTEVGFPTGTSLKAVTPDEQATYISAAIAQWTSWSFHGPIIFYTIRDLGTDAGNVDENMGMIDDSGTPKPVFAAVQQALLAPAAPQTPPPAPAANLPSVVGGKATISKPTSGTVTIRIPVNLSAPSAVGVSVGYTTASKPSAYNARSSVDYVGKSGRLIFKPGQTRSYVTVTIRAHNRRITNDRFLLRLSTPRNAVLSAGGAGYGVGSIR